jgi:hypothetical protein
MKNDHLHKAKPGDIVLSKYLFLSRSSLSVFLLDVHAEIIDIQKRG